VSWDDSNGSLMEDIGSLDEHPGDFHFVVRLASCLNVKMVWDADEQVYTWVDEMSGTPLEMTLESMCRLIDD
jgi:hypothetical protein